MRRTSAKSATSTAASSAKSATTAAIISSPNGIAFADYPGGILAHSTHLKGKGVYDANTGVEGSRIQVTLATSIPEGVCRSINLGYRDPATIDTETFAKQGWFVVPHAGETLYRLRP